MKFDEKAFENSKIKEIVIKAQKQFITDSYCFSNANELNSVLISSKKVEINSFCFLNCVSMTQFTVLEADDTQINDNVFDGCKALDTVKVSSKSHLKLGNFCFNAAANLKTVGISSQQIFFGSNCLDNCSSLSKIECNSAQVICCYKNSFKGMDSKEIINCPPETNVKIIENQNDDICTIYWYSCETFEWISLIDFIFLIFLSLSMQKSNNKLSFLPYRLLVIKNSMFFH